MGRSTNINFTEFYLKLFGEISTILGSVALQQCDLDALSIALFCKHTAFECFKV